MNALVRPGSRVVTRNIQKRWSSHGDDMPVEEAMSKDFMLLFFHFVENWWCGRPAMLRASLVDFAACPSPFLARSLPRQSLL